MERDLQEKNLKKFFDLLMKFMEVSKVKVQTKLPLIFPSYFFHKFDKNNKVKSKEKRKLIFS
jgi:hypothetical protein